MEGPEHPPAEPSTIPSPGPSQTEAHSSTAPSGSNDSASATEPNPDSWRNVWKALMEDSDQDDKKRAAAKRQKFITRRQTQAQEQASEIREVVHTTIGSGEVINLKASASTPPAIDYKGLSKKPSGPKVGYVNLLVSDGDDEDKPVVGNAFTFVPGYRICLKADIGRTCDHELTIEVDVLKGNKMTVPFSKQNEKANFTRASISWRPGVQIEGNYMIDGMVAMSLGNVQPGTGLFHPDIEKLFKDSKRKKTVGHITALTFRSGGSSVQGADKNNWRTLPKEVSETFDRLCFGDGICSVMTWFRDYNPTGTLDGWLTKLCEHANRHLPPYLPYLDESQQPVLDFDESPTLDQIGNGTFIKKWENSQPRHFYYHKLRLDFFREEDFALCVAMPTIRNEQWAREQYSHISIVPQRVYMQAVKPLHIPGIGITLNALSFKYNVFVRMQPVTFASKRKHDKDKRTTLGKAPEEGSFIQMEFDNEAGMKPHESLGMAATWKGQVIANPKGCLTTGTHFCVLMTKPYDMPSPFFAKTELANIAKDENLAKVHMDVVRDITASSRELEGTLAFTNASFEVKNLDPIRSAWMLPYAKQSDKKPSLVKYSARHSAYLQHISEHDSENQIKVVSTLGEETDCVLGIIAGPGAGKTTTMSQLTYGGAIQDKKVLVCGPSNVSVDTCAWSCYKHQVSVPKALRGRERIFWRLEVMGAEMRAMITVRNYVKMDSEDVEVTQKPETAFPDQLESDLEVMHAMSNALHQAAGHEAKHKALRIAGKTYIEAFAALRDQENRKGIDVPITMTTGWHLFMQVKRDNSDAQKEINGVVTAWMTQKPAAEIEAMKAEGAVSQGLLDAYAQPPTTKTQIQAWLKTGQIKSAESRDKSLQYRTLRDKFIQNGGKLPKKEMALFKKSWFEMMKRIFDNVDIILTTCNNAGSEILELGFKPDMVICDEAGQVTLGALSIVLARFTGYQGVWLFRDPDQLRPHNASGWANEFRLYATLSALGWLRAKGWPLLTLDTQYRMAPEIFDWPGRYFYLGLLKSDPRTSTDNRNRQIVRAVAREFYGGASLYKVIDVRQGFSRTAKNSTSLINPANVEVGTTLVERLCSKGLPPSCITMLTYYAAERTMLEQELVAKYTDNGLQWEVKKVKLKTLHSYQGQQNAVVILDIVIAYHSANREGWHDSQVDDSDDEDDADEEDMNSSRIRYITAHVKDANRLCCALTRAKDGLFVICKGETILGGRSNRRCSKEQGAIREMFLDAHTRGLVYQDYETRDNSPEGVKMRQGWGAQRQQAAWNLSESNRKLFLM